jgi:hypothetical protein
MELKTSIPSLAVRHVWNVAPLNTRYGGATGVSTGGVKLPTPTDNEFGC